MEVPSPRLTFSSIEDDPEYPGFLVEVHADGYAGATEVWVSRRDLRAFLDALDALDASLRGEARLKCGWVPVGQPEAPEHADLDLVIRPYGRAGQLQAEVAMRASSRWGRRHAVQLSFELPEPGALTRFRRALRDVADDPTAPSAILTPDFTEAGV
jgi:hypothetical protein